VHLRFIRHRQRESRHHLDRCRLESAHLTNRDVSENFFQLLGVHPFAGRAFTAEDTMQGRGDVVLPSYDFWQRRFGGDIQAPGQSMRKKGGPLQRIP
jgi:hypothetical protein